MAFLLYNSLTQKKEAFAPLHPPQVKMYCCGPTVYDLLHIGNFRGAVFFNFLRGWLEHKGYKVLYAYNWTDVDDKILARAQKENKTMKEVADKYIAEFKKDFKALKLKEHDYNPKATDFIPEMISLVSTLLKKEVAYKVNGDVFFSIERFAPYGKLSRRKKEELISGARVEVDKRKQHSGDFALWKSCKKSEPGWDSPWGYGRPGWHLECTTMIFSLLGQHIDIHGGGTDLIFPHHENELAQAEGSYDTAVEPQDSSAQGLAQKLQPVGQSGTLCPPRHGDDTVNPSVQGLEQELSRQEKVAPFVSPRHGGFVKYWVHNNMFTFGGEKMAKSTGNVSVMRDFLQEYNGEIFKYLVLSSHYRSLTEVSENKIRLCIQALSRIYTFLETAEEQAGDKHKEQEHANKEPQVATAEKEIIKSLEDDLNTPLVLSAFFKLIRYFNEQNSLKNKAGKIRPVILAGQIKALILKYGKIMSLFQEPPSTFLQEIDDIFLRKNKVSRKEVNEWVEKRQRARESGDFKTADQIRLKLLDMNIEVQDSSAGTKWRTTKTNQTG